MVYWYSCMDSDPEKHEFLIKFNMIPASRTSEKLVPGLLVRDFLTDEQQGENWRRPGILRISQ